MKKWYQSKLVWYGIFFMVALGIIFGLGRVFDPAAGKTVTTFSPNGINQFRKGMDIA